MKVTTQTNNNSNTTVSLTTFVKKSYKTKKGEDKFRLEPESKKVDMNALVEFIQNMLPNVIHHRNQLKHYRSIVKLYKELFGCIEIDVDFSEKLTVPLKYVSINALESLTNYCAFWHCGTGRASAARIYTIGKPSIYFIGLCLF